MMPSSRRSIWTPCICRTSTSSPAAIAAPSPARAASSGIDMVPAAAVVVPIIGIGEG
jgi:hypothetical protein